MGFAASQARLLLLTARKSDLEYRAQVISQQEMLLAMQTEEVATTYADKLSNRALFTTNTDGEKVMMEYADFATFGGLTWADGSLDNNEIKTMDPDQIYAGIHDGTILVGGSKDFLSEHRLTVNEGYYTEDDAQYDAEYRRETAALQAKEKRLQIEMKQVESQQKACDTEIDTVQKLRDKNIEKTFKYMV